MPLIDVRCRSCGTVSEVHRSLAMYPETPICPSCDGHTEQIHLPKSVVSYAPAVVVYQAPDGTFRVPGETSGPATGKYDRMGYTRIEARGWAEVRSLETRMNGQQAREIHQRVERQQSAHELGVKTRRSDFYDAINNGYYVPDVDDRGRATGTRHFVKMSARARDIAMAAIEKNNRKPGPRFKDPGGFIEAYSMDRSNRDESRRGDGKKGFD